MFLDDEEFDSGDALVVKVEEEELPVEREIFSARKS
jgi:hypothetical protein